MPKVTPHRHRDISWLDFNYRVLQESKDPTVPLMEKIKFLAIYSSNLEEFFRVRVANHRNLLRIGKKTKRELYFNPKEILKKIIKIVNEQQREFSDNFTDSIIPQLKEQGIHLIDHTELNKEQEKFADQYFLDNLLPFVQPVLLVGKRIKPFLNNAALYLLIHLQIKSSESHTSPRSQYAIVKLPSDHMPRFITIPSPDGDHYLMMLDDLVRENIPYIFPGYNVMESYSIKLTRDAELYIDDEFSGDLLTKIKNSLSKRNVGPPSRIIYDREMPAKMLNYLTEVLELKNFDLLEEGRYHNNSDFFKFPCFGKKHLFNKPQPPLPLPHLEKTASIFEKIADKDRLIHPPYHSYEAVIRFFEEAADDPDVSHIKIVQYRVAKESRIMDALMRAVEQGKQVTVFVEVKARFDEEANLRWGEVLEKAGVLVIYSFPGVKVHSKVALVRRRQKEGTKLYSYVSTGNFHEETTKIYSDLGIFTADKRITSEVARVFRYLETGNKPAKPFQHLLVGQFNLRPALEKLIQYEISQAKKGKKAFMLLKLNNLQDPMMIKLLYQASQAGVKVELIIRGINSLQAGVKGLSENIEAYSIVDRYLEHARLFYFFHGGGEKFYISSADWMVRNLSFRVETATPVYDQTIRAQLKKILHLQQKDNVKSRHLEEDRLNEYRQSGADMTVRSQTETYHQLKQQLENKRQIVFK